MRFAFALCMTLASAWAQEGTGSYPAILEQDAGLPAHTVYRPQDLSKVQGRLPIVAWGNGACANNGLAHRNFLMEIASHGYLVVAIGPPSAPGQARPAGGGPATKSTALLDAINWAVAENGRKESPYNGKLDPSKIAVMGMSCGGIQAYAVAPDPRVKLVGIFNSGILSKPPAGALIMEDVRKEQLDKLHSPIFFVMGDKTDIAYENGLDDFNRISNVPAIHMSRDGVGHGGTYSQPNGGEFARVAVAMLNWRLKGNKESSKMFLGENCGFCQDKQWHVSVKGAE